jgi:predicted ArsR family transcriptional regulator
MTSLSKFQLQLRSQILLQLESGPKSTRQIANAIDANYFTVRVAMRNLEDEGSIRGIYTSRGRDIKYEIGTNETTKNNVIPILRYRDFSAKLHTFADMHDKMATSALIKSIINVPILIAQLMKAAEHLQAGESQEQTMTLVRVSLEDTLKNIQDFELLLQQMLNEPRTWNPEILKRYPLDEDYNTDAINQIYNHYFHTED